MSSPEEIQSHRNILAKLQTEQAKQSAYLKLVAAEATLLIPLVVTVLIELWRR